MGLFSFFKKAGSKALVDKEKENKGSEMAENIAKAARVSVLKSVVNTLKLPIENLDVDLDDDKVTVKGTTDSHANREKIILALGNIEGIAEVDDYIRVDSSISEEESKFYTVKKGDSLSKIAKEFYGDAMKYPTIFEANKPMLDSPDKIYPGQLLRIPSLQA